MVPLGPAAAGQAASWRLGRLGHGVAATLPPARSQQEMPTAFGERVRVLRNAQDWSAEWLARESSLTITTVSTIEREAVMPTRPPMAALPGPVYAR